MEVKYRSKIIIIQIFQSVSKLIRSFVLLFVLERAVPLSVDHFNQNGNIKSISHIDAEVNVENDNDENIEKAMAESVNEKVSLGKADIEMAARDSKPNEKKDCVAVKEKANDENVEGEDRYHLFRYPKHKRLWQQFFWIIIWPMEFIFLLTIPNCEQKRFKNLFPFTFLMCIVWIGSLSYLVAWMITIVGKLLNENSKMVKRLTYVSMLFGR